jgi:hypothetical protein
MAMYFIVYATLLEYDEFVLVTRGSVVEHSDSFIYYEFPFKNMVNNMGRFGVHLRYNSSLVRLWCVATKLTFPLELWSLLDA